MTATEAFRTEAQMSFRAQGGDAVDMVLDFIEALREQMQDGDEVTLIELKSGYLVSEGDDAPMTLTATVGYC